MLKNPPPQPPPPGGDSTPSPLHPRRRLPERRRHPVLSAVRRETLIVFASPYAHPPPDLHPRRGGRLSPAPPSRGGQCILTRPRPRQLRSQRLLLPRRRSQVISLRERSSSLTASHFPSGRHARRIPPGELYPPTSKPCRPASIQSRKPSPWYGTFRHSMAVHMEEVGDRRPPSRPSFGCARTEGTVPSAINRSGQGKSPQPSPSATELPHPASETLRHMNILPSPCP